MEPAIPICLIGCGRWGRHILRDLLALGCEVSVADIDPDARANALAAGAYRLADSLEQLPPSEGVVIATPSSTHAEIAERALTRDVPVFVEKPLTTDAHSAYKLAALAPDRLFVMDKWRYHPGIEELRRIKESGELGQALGLHLVHAGWGTPHTDVDVDWILMPHCLSIVLEVFGSVPEVRSAFATNLNGKCVSLTAVLGDNPWVTAEVSSRSPLKRREFRLHCEQGVAWLDEGWADHIKIARGDAGMGSDASSIEVRSIPVELPLWRELRMFVEHLKGGPPPRSSAREGALITERIAQLRDLARR